MPVTLDMMEYATHKLAQEAYVSSALSDLVNEDCSNISGWADGGSYGTWLAEVNPAGQFRLKAFGTIEDSVSHYQKDWGSFPTQFTVEYKIYHDALDIIGADYTQIMFSRADVSLGVLHTTDGLYIYDGAVWNLIGAWVALTTWQTWRFEVDVSGGAANAVCDIYLDGVLKASAVDCSNTGTFTDGLVTLVQVGLVIDAEFHMDYIKVGTGLTPLLAYSESTIKQPPGSYSLKGIAKATLSLNDTLTRIIGTPIDLSDLTKIKLGIYASRTGGNIQAQILNSEAPILWSKLGSAIEITHPEIGKAGRITGGSYAACKFNNGFQIDANSEYVVFDNSDVPTSKGCIEFWFKPFWDKDYGTNAELFELNNGTTDGVILCTFYQADDKLQFQISVGGVAYICTWEPTWSANDLVHLGFTYDKDAGFDSTKTMAIYVNNVQVASTTDVFSACNWGTVDLTVGNRADNDRHANGIVDNIKILDDTKTDFSDKDTETPSHYHTHTPNIVLADTWQIEDWDISGIPNVQKDAIKRIIFRVINGDSDNTFYLDNMWAGFQVWTFAESLGLLEDLPSLDRTLSPLEESLALLEDLTQYARGLPLEESLALKEEEAASISSLLTENLGILESLPSLGRALSLEESLALLEALTEEDIGLTLEESLALLESLPLLSRALSLDEALALLESLPLLSRALSLDEALALLESLPTLERGLSLQEALALKEDLTEIARALTLTESLALLESETADITSLLTENLALKEDLTELGHSLTLEESLALLEELHAYTLLCEVDKYGNIKLSGLVGAGDAYAYVDSDGKVHRGAAYP